MTGSAIEEYVAAVRPRYAAAVKVEKGRILDEFCRTTGMHRKAAVRLLSRQAGPRPEQRGRRRRYGLDLLEVLVQLWLVSDRLCGKLLKPLIPDLLQALERHGELSVADDLRAQLFQISAASIDRLLRIHKRDAVRQPRRQASPNASLKSQVPIRTWSEWPALRPAPCRRIWFCTVARARKASTSRRSALSTSRQAGPSCGLPGAWASNGLPARSTWRAGAYPWS